MATREEAIATMEWITEHGAPGHPCDECGLPLVDGERGSVATVSTRIGHLLYFVCKRCEPKAMPNIRKDAERIMGRLVAEDVALILMAPDTVVQ